MLATKRDFFVLDSSLIRKWEELAEFLGQRLLKEPHEDFVELIHSHEWKITEQ